MNTAPSSNQGSPFFITRPASLKAMALSAPVGSGKTRAAVEYIASPAMRDQNVVYVAPTVRLLEQTAANLRARLALDDEEDRVSVVHSMSNNRCGTPARVEALRLLNEVEGEEGQVLILTTTTFLAVLADITTAHHWRVILDEAFSPVTFNEYQPGSESGLGWRYLFDVFTVLPDEGHRMVPREGCRGLVGDIAGGRWRKVGDMYQGLRGLAESVANPAMRVEVVLTEGIRSMLAGEEVPDSISQAMVLNTASYVAPEHFRGFREVLFLSALFEQTTLYQLWTRTLGVTFARHPSFPETMLRDTHGEQGPYVQVGHLLHPNDNASIYNLSRNSTTGQPAETEGGMRVIDAVVSTAADYFGDRPFLLQSNERYGYTDGAKAMPKGATTIPVLSHGLDRYQTFDNVVALAVTNPNPMQLEWVASRTGLPKPEVSQAFRIHTCYQAIGRSSIRAGTTTPKVFLTAGVSDARFLHDLFPGSTWLGQAGALPSFSDLAGAARPSTKTVETAQAIETYLAALEDHIEVISSRNVKAALGGRSIGDDLWKEAGRMVSGTWSRVGRSFVRTPRPAAEDYGFQVST